MGRRRYQANGFYPVGAPPACRRLPVAGTTTIVKGDILGDNGSGYLTTQTAFAATTMGVAAADCDNSAGAAGAKECPFYPIESLTQYIVPVAANAVITQNVVGTIVDLENNDDIDVSDTTIAAGPGFFVDEIDISTEAIAANTYGYAIGHFAYVS